MTTKTTQEIFDTVATHLLTQKVKAYGKLPKMGVGCAYRVKDESGNTLKCAVGCLIPDEKYVEEMEGRLVTTLLDDYPDCLGFTPTSEQRALLLTLQDIHDVRDGAWKERLTELAERKGLTMPEVAQ